MRKVIWRVQYKKICLFFEGDCYQNFEIENEKGDMVYLEIEKNSDLVINDKYIYWESEEEKQEYKDIVGVEFSLNNGEDWVDF